MAYEIAFAHLGKWRRPLPPVLRRYELIDLRSIDSDVGQ
jgi:hypothetical protein